MVHINPLDYCDSPTVFSYVDYFIQNYIRTIALPFFFTTSGFLLYRKIPLDSFDLNYVLRYIKRIFRLYIVWTIIYFPLEVIITKNGFEPYPYPLNVIFSGSIHLWYLNALMFSVAVISFLLNKKVKPKTVLIISFCFNLVAVLSQSWYGLIKPFQTLSPGLWNFVSSIFDIILTTKNGLFFGFLYVSIGMYFAYTNINIEKKKAFICLFVSAGLMLAELLFTDLTGIANGHEISFFMIPVTFFLFYIIKNSNFKLKNNNYELGSLSALIYYLHIYVGRFFKLVFSGIENTMLKSTTIFFLSLIITILISEVVIYLSKKKKFRFLTYLYK